MGSTFGVNSRWQYDQRSIRSWRTYVLGEVIDCSTDFRHIQARSRLRGRMPTWQTHVLKTKCEPRAPDIRYSDGAPRCRSQ